MMTTEFVQVMHPTHIGLLVRERRMCLGLHQHDLAAAAGVHFNWIIRLERGSENLQLSRVLRTFIALNIPIALDPHAEVPEWAVNCRKIRVSRRRRQAIDAKRRPHKRYRLC